MNCVHSVNMVHETNQAPDRRQRRRQAKRQGFIAAAWRVVVERGLEGLTMQAVAAEADVAVGGLYRYFDGKEGLVAALQVASIEVFGEHLSRCVASAKNPIETIQLGARAWGSFADSEPLRFALLDASLSDPSPNLPDESAIEVNEAINGVLGVLVRAFQAAEAQGLLSPGDPILRTHAVWASVHGSAHLRKRERIGSPPAHSVRDLIVDSLLRAWRIQGGGSLDEDVDLG